MKCRGLHCDGCGHGSGGSGALAVVVAVVIIIAAAGNAIAAAVLSVAEIVGYVLVAIAAAGAAAGIGYGVLRTRRHMMEVRDRRVSPQVRAVITDVRAGRPVSGTVTPGAAIGARRPVAGQLEPPRWRPAQPWELGETARDPEPAYGRSLIGDADRDWLTTVLREHYAAGRLSLEDLRRRVAVVLSVRYADEAAAALAGLPRLPWGER